MKKVLVTGASGFIGRHCQKSLLAHGYEVHAVSSKAPEQTREDIQWHQADLLDPEQVSQLLAQVQPSHLLHFAWYAVPGKYLSSSENLRWVQASLSLLQAFLQNGGQRLVAAGSCFEYNPQYGYCREDITPLSPATLYGICKHSLYMIFDQFNKQNGLSSAWGRIFFLYGPHEKKERLVSSVIRSLLRGHPAPCTHGNQLRDYLHVQDVADAFVEVLESDVQGSVNIASGRPVALKDIVYKISEKTNRPDLIQLGALPTPTNEPPLVVADVRRLFQEVGWQPQYDLDQGLDQTIRWWKKQLKEAETDKK